MALLPVAFPFGSMEEHQAPVLYLGAHWQVGHGVHSGFRALDDGGLVIKDHAVAMTRLARPETLHGERLRQSLHTPVFGM